MHGNHEYTPLRYIPECFKKCFWFPRHEFKDMVLFFAFTLRESELSQGISWKPGQSDKCPEFQSIIRFSWFPRNSYEICNALRTKAEYKTLSLNICRGNQLHILKHCGISLKVVYSLCFLEKPLRFFT